MDAITGFLHMGGYGAYVWPAFAAAALILAWMAVSTLRRLRGNERTLARLQDPRAPDGRPAEGARKGVGVEP